MDIQETVAKIRTMSEMVVAQLGPHSGIAFGLDRQSVEWVDGFIERQRVRPELTPQDLSGLVNKLGSYLGECIVAHTKGAWSWIPEQNTVGVRFSDGNCVFPFTKVHKQFSNGKDRGDSVLGLYDAVISLHAAGRF